MRFTLFGMEIDDDNHNPDDHLSSVPAHQHLPVSVNCFGGIRHGFNSRSIRAIPYPFSLNSSPHPYHLAPMQSATSNPFSNIRAQDLPAQQVTTLAASRISSEEIGSMSPSFMEQAPAHIDCGRHTRYTLPIQRSVPEVDLAETAFNAASRSARIAVNNLLNSAPASEDQWDNGDLFSSTNNATAKIHGIGQARTMSTGSLMSISSSATLQPTSSSAPSRISLIVDLYYTSTDATNSYISTLRPVRRHTACSVRCRHHPYAHGSRPRAPKCGGRSRTLMDNISAICTHMWRRAKSDILAPHREEAGTVRDMRDLYAWGEVISRAFQSDDLEESDMDWESARGSLCSGMGTDMWTKVGEAAKRLCEWLGNEEAILICEDVVNELKKLKEKEDCGGDIEGLDSIS
ncbi:hypothetical protein N431DRAFT_476231 [Stipitochalara longipes BDJ]|nr:hypothetical protein N431DRAFT_476231 [Stipitochalara longipes BDJ]